MRSSKAPLKTLVLFLCLIMGGLITAASDNKLALLLDIDKGIGPATQDYIERGLSVAKARGAKLVILRIDTPGGLDKSMRGIIKAIIASPIPVASYVSPSGARAASAGTYILYASHIAAMAPATNLGAASPVSIGGGFPMPGQSDDPKDKTGKAKDKSPADKSTLEKKVANDAKAYIRSLAQLHNRNVTWAEKAVTEAASLAAKDALQQQVIDIVATDLADLLQQTNGKTINLQGNKFKLDTENLLIETYEPDWRSQFLAVITDPSVAYILFLLGLYGLFFEFANPGFIVPGVVGAIALLLALYAFQLLPVNYAGLALIILGIAFLVGEAFMPSFGALGIGGVIAFAAGSLLLLETDIAGFGISWPLIMTVTLVNAALVTAIIHMAIRSRTRPIVNGPENLLDKTVEVVEDFVDNKGTVKYQGELWRAISDDSLAQGEQGVVCQVKGLTISVKRKENK